MPAVAVGRLNSPEKSVNFCVIIDVDTCSSQANDLNGIVKNSEVK